MNTVTLLRKLLIGLGLSIAIAGFDACSRSASVSVDGSPIPVARNLSKTGPWFIDEQGRVVIIHGTAMINKLTPYYPAALGFGDKDLSFLAQNGFNTLRIGFIWAGVEPNPGQYDDAYIDQIAALATKVESYGLIPLMDFHQDSYSEVYGGEGAPAWASISYEIPGSPQIFGLPGASIANENFWLNAAGPDGIGLQDHYAAAWQHVAERLRSDPHAVFEPYNEPSPGVVDFPVCVQPAGCPEFDVGLLAPFYKKVIQAIRKSNPTRLIMVEPNALFDLDSNTWLPSMGDPQVGFAFHDYCPLALASLPPGLPVVPSIPCNQLVALPLMYAQSRFNSTGETNLMDEFGAGDTDDDTANLLDQADQQMLSWVHWAYWAQDYGNVAPYGLSNDLTKVPEGDNIKQGLLQVLSRPSPRLIAGTPQSWNWNASTATFTAAYSTARADGSGSFAANAVSTFFVHPRFYPNGYQIQVTGGKVISAANGAWLQIASLSEVSTITLTITPAAAH